MEQANIYYNFNYFMNVPVLYPSYFYNNRIPLVNLSTIPPKKILIQESLKKDWAILLLKENSSAVVQKFDIDILPECKKVVNGCPLNIFLVKNWQLLPHTKNKLF